METTPGLRALMDEREKQALERHAALKESIAAALLASDKAVAAAAKALDARVTLLNELRQVVESQAQNFATKLEVTHLREIIGKLESESNRRTGRDTGAGQSWHFLALAVAILAGLVGVAAFVRGL